MGKQVGTFVVSIVASLGTRNKRGGWRCLRVNALTPGPSPCRVVCGRGLLVGLGEGGLSMAFGASCGGKGSMELALVCPRSHAPRGNAVWTLCVRPHPRPPPCRVVCGRGLLVGLGEGSRRWRLVTRRIAQGSMTKRPIAAEPPPLPARKSPSAEPSPKLGEEGATLQ